MGRISISLALILITFFSCKSYYQNQNGGYRPKKPKFELANPPYQLKKDDLIDTNAVYVHEATIYYGSGPRKEDFFIRFFANGRYCMGIARAKKLTLEDVNGTHDYNTIGYYKLNGNNIEIETFTVGGQFGTTPFYDKMNAIIKNDSILFVGDKVDQAYLSAAKKNGSFYVRRKVEGLTGTPDW